MTQFFTRKTSTTVTSKDRDLCNLSRILKSRELDFGLIRANIAPYVDFAGLKSTTAANLIMTFHDSNLWRLFNNVLLQIVENMGEDITPKICGGTKGKPATEKKEARC